ncbi:hypothetical protein CR513_44911, partial [Mucuna pruriens]
MAPQPEQIERGGYRTQAQSNDELIQFTPLKVKRIQIQREVYHTQLLDFLPTTNQREEWCEFHREHGHTTEDFKTLQVQIEKLIQQSYLGRFI